jgi:DNA repair exonuclease SbcCD ATPase subunit
VRKFYWAIPVIIAIALVGYFRMWPLFRDRDNSAEIDALTSEINTASADVDKVVAEEPANPSLDDLALSIKRYADLNKKTNDLIPRMREMVPKLRGDAGMRFQEAQKNYQKKADLIGVKLNEMQKRIDELKAKEPKLVGQDAPSPAEKAAREVVEQWVKGLNAGDPDAIMKIVAVPYLLGNERKILKDQDALRVEVENICARQKKRPAQKFEIRSVKTVAAFEEANLIPTKIFSEVMDREKDRIVQVIRNGFVVYLGVRIEKDSAKIVGTWET